MARPRKPKDQRQNRVTKDMELVPVDELEIAVPEPPQALSDDTRVVWDAFWVSPLAQIIDPRSDLGLVRRWIQWLEEFNRTKEQIDREGRTVEGSKGQPRPHPLLGYLSAIESHLHSAEQQLGLTPQARLRLGIAVNEFHTSVEELNRMLDEEEKAPDGVIEGEWEEI